MMREYGVELEFSSDWNVLCKYAKPYIRDVYGPRSSYAKKDRFDSETQLNKWHLKEENCEQSELCTPVFVLDEFEEVLAVLDGLFKESDLEVSAYDGFHVHVDVSDLAPEHIIVCWLMIEQDLLKCFPPDRRKNSNCVQLMPLGSKNKKPLISERLKEAYDVSTSYGNANLDFEYYDDRKTVEVRLAEGTKDIDFVEAWIYFLDDFFYFASQMSPTWSVCEKVNSKTFEEIAYYGQYDTKWLEKMLKRKKLYQRKRKLSLGFEL